MEAPNNPHERIAAIAALDQPLRRRLYALLADRDTWTTRDEAAAALDVARSVAAFHLDKLADAGVVDVSFERPPGRVGPGAGRPSKQYRLAGDEISASMPDRRYDLAAQLLAAAVSDAMDDDRPVDQCLQRVARATGRSLALEVRTDTPAGGPVSTSDVLAALGRRGYEPHRVGDGEIVLANCPFHRLAESHRTLVCGMNLDLLRGLTEALPPDVTLEARLAPEPGYCCVRLHEH